MKKTVMVPSWFSSIPIAGLLESDQDTDSHISQYKPLDDVFLSLIHTALKPRGDILAHDSYTGVRVSEKDVLSCIPDTLCMFTKVLYGGQEVIDQGNKDDDEDGSIGDQNTGMSHQMLSLVQDVAYNVSKGKKWTPENVGLGLSLHQATRSKVC